MAVLNNLVDALASRAGWKRPRQDKDGAYCFRLENGLDFAVFSPDGRAAVLRAEVADVPASGPDREEMLRAAARRQAGVCRVRASVAALEKPGQSLLKSVSGPGDRLVLYRMAELDAGQEAFDATTGAAQAMADRLVRCGVGGIWNFTNYEIACADPEVVVESVHFSDSLLALSYMISQREDPKEEET